MKRDNYSILKLISSIIVVSLLFSSCSVLPIEQPSEQSSSSLKQFQQNLPYTEVKILLEIPKATDNEIIFELIDDITGIELNPTRYIMAKLDEKNYELVLPIKAPSQIKYRFYKNNGLPIYETDSENNVVQFRMAYVTNESSIPNILANWQDEQYDHKFGKISGQIVNSETNSPIPNALVVVGGKHSYSNSMGNFRIEKIPPGKHNLVISSTDGEYQTFQQEAIIGEGLTTQANIGLKSSAFINVSFVVDPPENTPETASIRILGNTYQLGNVFGNIYNGTSIAPARAPKLSILSDGNYAITLSLPAGLDLRYKYSLGDGFWNAELNKDGNFVVRQLVVPEQDIIINDVIQNWGIADEQTVDFLVNIPENTPNSDVISIQFNSFGWSPPIHMWKISETLWAYQLLGPFQMVGKIDYRFCRNDACDIAFDSSAPVNGYSFDSTTVPQSFEVNITNWNGWGLEIDEPELNIPEIFPRQEGFIAGFSISDNYNVYTPIHIEKAYQNMTEVNANTTIIPIKWTLSSTNPVVFEPITGLNPLWKDLVLMIQKAQKNNLRVWLSPQIELSSTALRELSQTNDFSDFENKFSSDYRDFLNYSADLANYMSVEGIIYPTEIFYLPGIDQNDDIKINMSQTLLGNLDGFRNRFNGKHFISINHNDFSDSPLLSAVDGYLIIPEIDFVSSDFVGENYETTVRNYFQQMILPIFTEYSKPIIIGVNYPSITGTENGCIKIEDHCVDFETVNNLDYHQDQDLFSLDFNTQIILLNATFMAINDLDWINGIVSLNYNPQVAIMDYSSSLRGKPSIGVLWYWYPRLLGIPVD